MMMCCCGCPTIGLDGSADPTGWTSCCFTDYPSNTKPGSQSLIINLKDDVSRLGECRVVFANAVGGAGRDIRFAAGDWPAVQSYVTGGGRLWIAGTPPDYTGGGGTLIPTNVNTFLTALGATIQLDTSYAFYHIDSSAFCGRGRMGPANIGADLDDPTFFTAGGAFEGFGIVLGGTVVSQAFSYIYPPGSGTFDLAYYPVVTVEKVGNGFVFLSGNFGAPCPQSNCRFWPRLWLYDDSQII
jgi:hypothetical protein